MRLVATFSALLVVAACRGGPAPREVTPGPPAAVREPEVEPSPHCKAAEGTMKIVWNQRIRGSIQRAFFATSRPYAVPTAARVSDSLAAFAADIERGRHALCDAERDDPAAPTRDAHFCLDRRLSLLEALTELFTESANEPVVDAAIRVVLEVEQVPPCDTVDAPAMAAPDDDDERHALLDAWAANEAVRVRLWARDYAGAYARIEALTNPESPAGESVEVEVDRAVLRAELAGRVAMTKSRADVVADALDVVTDAGNDEARAAVLVRSVAIASTSKLDELVAEVDAALAEHDNLRARSDLYEIRATRAHSADETLDHLRHAIIARTNALGDAHPAVADLRVKAAIQQADRKAWAAAAELAEAAADAYESAFGAGHVTTGETRFNQGTYLHLDEQWDAAVVALDKALGAYEGLYVLDDLRVTEVHKSLVETLSAAGRFEEGETRARDMLARAELLAGDSSLGIAWLAKVLGRVLWHRHKWDEAEHYFSRALDIRRELLSYSHVDITWSIHDIGDARCGKGDYESGIEHYEDAYTRFQTYNVRQYIAHIQWDLARCVWAQGTDKKRALELATKARDEYASINPERSLEIGAWLQEHAKAK